MALFNPISPEILAAYLNGTLTAAHRLGVRLRLTWDPGAREMLATLQKVQSVVRAQDQDKPAADLFDRISAHLPLQAAVPATLPPRGFRWDLWVWGLGALIMVLFAGWYFLPPGIQLQWSALGSQPETFQLYRAPAETGIFELIAERPAEPGVQAYTFTDVFINPGSAYLYQVCAVQENGTVLSSQPMRGNARVALPGQLVVVLVVLVLAYGLTALRDVPQFPFRTLLTRAV